MRALLLTCFLMVICTTIYAQKDTLANINKPSTFDVNVLSSNIVSHLANQLELTKEQQPRVASVVNTCLSAKWKIWPLYNKDTVAYQQKQQVSIATLNTQLKVVLLQRQMAKFATLKPIVNDANDVLWHLFY